MLSDEINVVVAPGEVSNCKSSESAAVRPAHSVRGNDGARPLWEFHAYKRGRVDNEKNENTGIGNSENTKKTLQKKIFSLMERFPEKISQYCVTDNTGKTFAGSFFVREWARKASNRILRVAKTAADLAGSEIIREEHVGEADGTRSMDEQYWK